MRWNSPENHIAVTRESCGSMWTPCAFHLGVMEDPAGIVRFPDDKFCYCWHRFSLYLQCTRLVCGKCFPPNCTLKMRWHGVMFSDINSIPSFRQRIESWDVDFYRLFLFYQDGLLTMCQVLYERFHMKNKARLCALKSPLSFLEIRTIFCLASKLPKWISENIVQALC